MSELFTTKIDNAAIINALDRLSELGDDQTELMERMAGIMHRAVEDNFAAQGRPKWKSLRPSTIRNRTRRGYWPGKILQQRGDLAMSIQQAWGKLRAAVGTNKIYAAIQNFGGVIKKKESWGSLYLRTDRNGNLLRQKSNKNLLVFAKASHKQRQTRYFAIDAHEIRIPKREFLMLTDYEITEMAEMAERFLVWTAGMGK